MMEANAGRTLGGYDSYKARNNLQLNQERKEKASLESANNKAPLLERALGSVYGEDTFLGKAYGAAFEAMGEHKGADRSFKSAFIDGAPVKDGGKVVSDTLADQTNRMSTAFQPAIEGYLNGDLKKADVVAGLGSYVMGIVNMGFSPVAGALKGAESIPVLGLVATGLNKFAAGLGGLGGNVAVQTLEALPFDQETKSKLTPLANEVGALIGMLLGFKATGKAASDVMGSRFVKPHVEKLETKLKEMGEIIKNDPKLSTEVARFVAEHGPVRDVPITSETPGATDFSAPQRTGNLRVQNAGDSSGRIAIDNKAGEYYPPADTLPIIDFGKTPKKIEGPLTEVVYLPREQVYATAPKEVIDSVKTSTKGETEKTIKIIPAKEVPKNVREVSIGEVSNLSSGKVPKQGEPIKGNATEDTRQSSGADSGSGTASGGFLKPVTGTGTVNSPQHYERLFSDAIKEKIEKKLDGKTYQGTTHIEQGKLVSEFYQRDPKGAMRAAVTGENVPSNIVETHLWEAMIKIAEETKNEQLQYDLAKSPITDFGSKAGQSLSFLSKVDKDSATSIIRKIDDTWKKDFENRTKMSTEEATAQQVNLIKKFIEESVMPKEKWIEIINDIKTC
jgi:hypothetical protein